MKKNYKRLFLFLSVAVCTVSTVFAQYNITLRIVAQPAAHVEDSIFAAGNFTNWQPDKKEFNFIRDSGHLSVQIKNIPAAVFEFKCTRGNWEKTESTATGADRGNRLIMVSADTTIDITIAAWKDDFAAAVKPHTASKNVHLADTAFVLPQLNTTRRIWIYLPAGYDKSKKRFPVMYLQDGQNIFDEFTAGFGEWGVDESLDSLIKIGVPPCIVIGIDNGPERMQEYNPYEFKDFGKGMGDAYVEFLVHTLKPFIDKHYRTLSSKNNTIIGGSSMGGLISFYAMLKYPGVFGNGGIFSPAFWTAKGIKNLSDSTSNMLTGKLFFYMGALEGEAYLNDMNEIVETVAKKSDAMIYTVVDPRGQHNEQAWRKWFTGFYKWIMADGFNSVIELEN